MAPRLIIFWVFFCFMSTLILFLTLLFTFFSNLTMTFKYILFFAFSPSPCFEKFQDYRKVERMIQRLYILPATGFTDCSI